MTVLIELYDKEEPLNNVLSLTALKPDLLVMLGDSQITKQRCQRPISSYIQSCGMMTGTEFISCRTYDITDICVKLESIIDLYGAENCVIDVLGGSDTMLMAVGCCCKDRPELRVVTQRAKSDELVWLWGPKADAPAIPFQANLEQLIALAGGELLRNGHIATHELNDELLDLIPTVFEIYMENRPQWAAFVLYLQQLNAPEYQSHDGLCLSGPRSFQVNKRSVSVDPVIVMCLEDAGVVSDFRMTAGGCTIHFTNADLLRYLCDVGSWLELYMYARLKRSGLFREVEISTVVSWDDDNDASDVINEIDVIALDGLGQLFISCKTNVPDASVLNEIATLTERFGTQYAVPVLVTACRMQQDAPVVLRRAREMGVVIIDADDLFGDALIERLQSLRRTWDAF